jgi:hypothetical protein
VAGKIVIILDIQQVLSSDEIATLAKVSTPAENEIADALAS